MGNVMSKVSGVTWIDLTDMLVWSGSYTGIQRVTYEYAIRFEKQGAKFFAYDAMGDRFFDINLQDVLDLHKADSNHHARLSSQKITIKKKIRNIVGAPYYRASDEVKIFMQPYVHALNHTVRSALHAIQSRHKVSGSIYAGYPVAQFREDDTVVLLGAGWNEMRVLKRLAKLKDEVTFHLVQHINDILPIYQPHLFADELPEYFRPYVMLAFETADMITVISEATKRDVITFYDQQNIVSPPPVEVIRLGDNPQTDSTPKKPTAVSGDENFILAVGTFEIRKNYQLVYQAIKLAELEGRSLPKIVIAGRDGWLSRDIRHVIERDPFVSSHIIRLNNVSDEELKWLYDKCMFTIFPSLAEGWGLPIAESLGYGKMCLASGVSSMLEIGDGLVDYFLPYDARECMEKIVYYTSQEKYVTKNQDVLEKYTIYSWDESFNQLKTALQKLS